MTVYLATSAAAKLVVEEPESEALVAFLDDPRPNDDSVISSALLETELRRLGVRLDAAQSTITDVLVRVDLVEPDRALFLAAGLLPGTSLRSLDALHLATALRVDADLVVAYDRRLLDAAKSVGLATLSPAATAE